MDVYEQIVEKVSEYKSGESRKGRKGVRGGGGDRMHER